MSASPLANAAAVSMVRCWRAARASGVGWRPSVRNWPSVPRWRWRSAGTGGSWDRPPEPMNRTFLSAFLKYFADGGAELADAAHLGEGRATELMKTGMTGLAAMSP